MLTAAQRLRRSGEFDAAIRNGRRAGRGVVVAHLALPKAAQPVATRPTVAGVDPESVPARAGFVVSRAVGGAVVRNRIRRQLRHLVRDRLAGLPAGAVLVVRALPDAAGTSHARLEADLDAALSAARRPARRSR